MEMTLRRKLPFHNWIVRTFDERRYLIEAPSQQWLESMVMRRKLHLENVDLFVQGWDPIYDEGARTIQCG